MRNAAIRKCTCKGDKVYTVADGKITEHTVDKIYDDFLVADDDFYDFEEVGKTWFLTELMAKRLTSM